MDPSELTAAGLAPAIASGEVKAREATDAVLAHIESRDPDIHAYLSLMPDEARAQADDVDRRVASGEPVGPLAGVPVAVKDNMCVVGGTTTCASRILENFASPYDATVISKLREADAVIVGKTNLDEFAMGSSCENSAFGPTRNPRDLDRVPGGSSGGSAAAVASGMCVVALGSDTGGSIRQPASFCGIVGMKPTYSRVSRYGLVAFASSLDQIGPMARTVEDAAILLEAISGHDPSDSTSAPQDVPNYRDGLDGGVKGMCIGVPKEYFGEGLNAEVRANIERVIERLADEGADLLDVSLPHLSGAVATYYVIATSEASSNLARYDGVKYGYRTAEPADLLELYRRTRSEGYGDEVKRRILLGTYALSSGYYDAFYGKAQQVRALIAEDFRTAFETVDAIVTPTTPTTAFRIGEMVDDPLAMYLQDIYTVSANLAAIPGISVPAGDAGDGLPTGLQVLGPQFGEATILRVARAVEVFR